MDRTQDALLLIGRLLVAALFLPSGINKLMGFSQFAGTLASRGLPFPDVFAAAAVAIEVLAPIALILGAYHRTAALALLAFVIAASLTSHRYWEMADQARRANEIQFFKNVAIIGAMLFYYVTGPGAWSLGRHLRRSA